MKLFSIIVLLSIFSVSFAALADLNGPHGDGRFLANPDSSTAKACGDGEFNKLTVVGTAITNWDGTKYVTKCTTCGNIAFLGTAKDDGGYQQVLTNLADDGDDQHSLFNRRECCFNSDNAICREQLRAYKEGCHDTGAYEATNNNQGYGVCGAT